MKGNGVLFNSAGSSSIKQVDSQNSVTGAHSIPMQGPKNSVTKLYDNSGNLVQERYYDEDGNAYLDIDYSDHGNPMTHPTVPHQHHITWQNGKPHRGKGEAVT